MGIFTYLCTRVGTDSSFLPVDRLPWQPPAGSSQVGIAHGLHPTGRKFHFPPRHHFPLHPMNHSLPLQNIQKYNMAQIASCCRYVNGNNVKLISGANLEMSLMIMKNTIVVALRIHISHISYSDSY